MDVESAALRSISPVTLPPIRVGSQLFINRGDSPAAIAQLVRQMADAQLRIMRLFIQWDHVEPARGTWRWDQYDAAFTAAETCGIAVVPTLMSVSPPGWMRCTAGPQEVGPLEDPEFIARSDDYIRRVVNRWKHSPALDSWILWNEPDRSIPKTPATWRAYVAFLREYYENDIAEYNRWSFHQFEDFEQVSQQLPPEVPSGPSFASRIDQLGWARFSVANVSTHLRRIASGVRKLDPSHPVHLNPHRVSQCLLQNGQSLWEEGRIADFMGCSAHPVWHSTRFRREQWPQSVAMFADLMRSCTRHPEELFWVSELQAGPTVFTGFTADCPSREELRLWLWESVAAGARAIVYWCFNWRSDGYEAGEWSLLGQNGAASERLRETTSFVRELERHAELLSAARPPSPEVLILYSEASLLLSYIEGENDDPQNPRNRQMAADALCGAYLMLSDLGREVQFVDERLVQEGRLPATAKSIVVPGAVTLEPGTLDALTAFAERGGTVIADHLVAWKTPDGAMDDEAGAKLRRLFGSSLADIQSKPGAFKLCLGAAGAVPGWFVRLTLQPEDSAKVVARWENEEIAAVASERGSGQAVRIGTAFFQRYLSGPDGVAKNWLRELLPPSLAPVQLRRAGVSVRLRNLCLPAGVVSIVLNNGGSTDVELVCPQEGQLTAAAGGNVLLRGKGRVNVTLPAGSVQLFHFEHPPAHDSNAATPTDHVVGSKALHEIASFPATTPTGSLSEAR